MRRRLISGIRPSFPGLSRCRGQVTHVLLTRSPLGATRCCHQVVLARLACIKHAASVHPEPGSNSPSEIVNSLRSPEARRGCSRMELGDPGATEFDHPSRTYRGDGRCKGPTLHRSRLIRYPDAPRNRSEGGEPPTGRGFGTGFSHTVEFSRNVAGLLFGDSPAVPASCHRRSGGTVPRASQIVKDFPPARSAYSWWSTTRHVDTFTQKRRPAPDLLGVRTATEQPSDRILWRSATSCLPMPTPLASFRRGPRS